MSQRSWVNVTAGILGCVVIVSLWVAFGQWMPGVIALWHPLENGTHAESGSIFERAGQFGDMYGSLNAVLSLLTLILVYFTFRHQREELKESRQSVEEAQVEGHFLKALELFRYDAKELFTAQPEIMLQGDDNDGSPSLSKFYHKGGRNFERVVAITTGILDMKKQAETFSDIRDETYRSLRQLGWLSKMERYLASAYLLIELVQRCNNSEACMAMARSAFSDSELILCRHFAFLLSRPNAPALLREWAKDARYPNEQSSYFVDFDRRLARHIQWPVNESVAPAP